MREEVSRSCACCLLIWLTWRRRRSGLLVIFARNHPMCDFAYCRYNWTANEAEAFLRHAEPPLPAHKLPSGVDLLLLCYYVGNNEAWIQGPTITPAQFRRLNSCTEPRLVIWDLGGVDTLKQPLAPVVIPSADISPTQAQRSIFAANLTVREANKRTANSPTVSSLLNTGLFAAEYAPDTAGPCEYDGNDWSTLWKLLEHWTQSEPLQHPKGLKRDPETYRCSLRKAHQRLVQQHSLRAPGYDEVMSNRSATRGEVAASDEEEGE